MTQAPRLFDSFNSTGQQVHHLVVELEENNIAVLHLVLLALLFELASLLDSLFRPHFQEEKQITSYISSIE